MNRAVLVSSQSSSERERPETRNIQQKGSGKAASEAWHHSSYASLRRHRTRSGNCAKEVMTKERFTILSATPVRICGAIRQEGEAFGSLCAKIRPQSLLIHVKPGQKRATLCVRQGGKRNHGN